MVFDVKPLNLVITLKSFYLHTSL